MSTKKRERKARALIEKARLEGEAAELEKTPDPEPPKPADADRVKEGEVASD